MMSLIFFKSFHFSIEMKFCFVIIKQQAYQRRGAYFWMREGGGEKWVGKHQTYILKIIKVKVALMLRQRCTASPKQSNLKWSSGKLISILRHYQIHPAFKLPLAKKVCSCCWGRPFVFFFLQLACSKFRPLRTDDDLRHETVINHMRQMDGGPCLNLCLKRSKTSLIELKQYVVVALCY